MEEVYDLDMRVQDILRPEGEWITTTSSLQQQQAGVMLFQLKYGSWTFPDFGVLQSWALNPVARAQALEVAGRGKGSRVQVQGLDFASIEQVFCDAVRAEEAEKEAGVKAEEVGEGTTADPICLSGDDEESKRPASRRKTEGAGGSARRPPLGGSGSQGASGGQAMRRAASAPAPGGGRIHVAPAQLAQQPQRAQQAPPAQGRQATPAGAPGHTGGSLQRRYSSDGFGGPGAPPMLRASSAPAPGTAPRQAAAPRAPLTMRELAKSKRLVVTETGSRAAILGSWGAAQTHSPRGRPWCGPPAPP